MKRSPRTDEKITAKARRREVSWVSIFAIFALFAVICFSGRSAGTVEGAAGFDADARRWIVEETLGEQPQQW